MLGVFDGSCIAKTMVPYSRVPGFILVCVIVFSLPHLTTIVILIKSVIGDALILGALLFFLFANMVHLPWGSIVRSLPYMADNDVFTNGILEPNTHEGASVAIERRQKLALVLQMIFVIFLILWVFFSTPLKEFMELGLAEIHFTTIRDNFFTDEVLELIGWTCVKTICTMFGLAKVACVCFFDASLYGILLVDECDNDPHDDAFRQEHGNKERALLLELHQTLDVMEQEYKQIRQSQFQGHGQRSCCLCCCHRRETE